MRRNLVLVTLLIVACQGPRPGSICEQGRCPEPLVCDAPTNLCVTNSAPVITVTSHHSGQLLNATLALLEGTVVDDEDAVTTLEVTLDDGALWIPVALDGERFSHPVVFPPMDSQPFSIRFRARDRWENESEFVLDVSVDNVAPACKPVSPVDGQVLTAPGGTEIQVEFAATDGSGVIARADIAIGEGAAFEPADIEGTRVWGNWVSPPDANGSSIPITLHAIDPSGNRCTLEIGFLVDNVPPSLAVTSPTLGALIGFSEGNFFVTGTAADGAGRIQSVIVELEGVANPVNATLDANTFSANVSLPHDDYKERRLRVTATDAAGNSFQRELPIIIDVIPPTVTFHSPSPSQQFNIASMGSSDEVRVTWTSADGDPNITVTRSVLKNSQVIVPEASAQGTGDAALDVTTTPADDHSEYRVLLVARDRGGNGRVEELSFIVDRVRPTPIISIADRERVAPRVAVVSFSEPVVFPPQFATPPVVTYPINPGVNRRGDTLEVTGFLADTVQSLSVSPDAVTDLAGNGNTSASSTFHTEPAVPPNGPLMSSVNDFAVTFDQDGVLYFLARSSSTLTWKVVDPKTGATKELTGVTLDQISRFQTIASRTVNGDLTARRLAGVSVRGSYNSIWADAILWTADLSTVQTSSGYAVLPVPASCAEPTGLSEVAVIQDSSGSTVYHRDGRTDEEVGIEPTHVLVGSAEEWELLRLGGSMQRRIRRCECSSTPRCDYYPSASSAPATVLSDLANPPKFSMAIANGTRVYVYDSASGDRVEACQPCATGGCSPVTRTSPRGEGLRVAPKHDVGWILGARVTSAGVELLQRDLNQGCLSAWQIIATVPGSSGASKAEPVMFGRHPGVLYLQGTDLKVYVP